MSNCTMGLFSCKCNGEGKSFTSRCHGSKISTCRQIKTSLKKWICPVSNYIDLYLISFNLSNVGEIFWVKSYRTVSKFRKRKRKFLCRVHPLDKAGEWNWEVPWRSRATTAKKCTKKCDAQAKLFFCQSKSVNPKFRYHSNVTSHFSTLYCSFGVDVTAAMLVIRNKSITLLWEVKPAI